MRTLLTFAAIVCLTALPAYSADPADGHVSRSSLTRLGLAGMTPMSDVQGLEIRGLGVAEAMGFDDGYGEHKEYGKDKHEEHKHKEHKHHEQKHHEKHENCFECKCHEKASCNFSSLCHTTHCSKAG
jgi:hypothetical protein